MFPEKQHADHQARNRHRVPALRQVLNVIGCALAIPLYYLTTAHSRYPVTLDIVITIALTELNRYVIEGCRMSFGQRRGRGPETSDEIDEKAAIYSESQPQPPRVECLAAVVGWREDPALYARALESYKSSSACVFLLAGIDGDEAEDQDMARVFKKVCALKHWARFQARHPAATDTCRRFIQKTRRSSKYLNRLEKWPSESEPSSLLKTATMMSRLTTRTPMLPRCNIVSSWPRGS